MRKKLVSFILAVCLLLLPTLNAGAFYTLGPRTYDLAEKDVVDAQHATVSGTSITGEAGGSVEYDFWMPFLCESVTVNYAAGASGTVTIMTEDGEFTVSLNSGGGSETYNYTSFVRSGAKLLTVKFGGAATINSITFNKANTSGEDLTMQMTDQSDEDYAISASVLMDENASMIMVNGQRRYINIDDPKQIPTYIDGSIYLPLHTICRAFGYYYEELPEKDYILIRNNDFEINILNGKATKKLANGTTEEIANPVKVQNGVNYLPVRTMAEMAGETVIYKDGFIVIDNKYAARDIVNDENLFNYARDKFKSFYPEYVAGTTYYVAQTFNASDDNPGTIDRPFRTLNKAGEVAKAGDTVIIREGTYRETFAPKNDGTPTNPIIYKAADGEKVTISAGEYLENFADNGDGTVSKKLTTDLGDGKNQVFYNGEALIEARYPNGPGIDMGEGAEPLSKLFPVVGDFFIPDGDNLTVTSETLLNQDEPDYWKDATFVSMHGLGWSLSTAKIKSSENGKLHLGDTSAPNWWYNAADSNKMDFGYITGHIHAMDEPGEWVVQNNTLVIIPPEGETAETLKLEVKARQLVADLAERKYVQMIGIDTIGGSMKMNNSEMCVINGGEMKYISHYTHGHDQRTGYIDDGDTTNPNGAAPRGEVGIYVGGTDNVIVNSVFDHSAGAGIYTVGTYMYLENNIVSNCGYMGSYISGISAGAEKWKPQNTPRGGFAMYNNTVYNSGRSVLNFQAPENWDTTWTPYLPFEVAYNDFHDGVLFSLDTGITYEYCIYTQTDKLQSSHHNNMVYYTLPETNPYSFGVYHDGGSIGINTYNDIVFTTREGVRFSQAYYHKAHDTVNMWNNSTIRAAVIGGKDALKITDFPKQQPYFTGSKLQAEPFMMNYELATGALSPAPYYKASDATLSEGVTLDENGRAVFTGNGQWVEFKDVDFGSDGNNVIINFSGDKYKGKNSVAIMVGDTIETAEVRNTYLTADAPDIYGNNLGYQAFSGLTGKHNVFIRVDTLSSLIIDGIYIDNRGVVQEGHDGTAVYGGEFNNIDKAPDPTLPPDPKFAVAGSEHPMVNNVWGGTVLRYNNVEVKETAYYLAVSAATEGEYAGERVIVGTNVIGAATIVPVGEYVTKNTGWDNYGVEYVKLKEPVQPGTYDMYLTFEGDNKTCNFYYFGLLSELPEGAVVVPE